MRANPNPNQPFCAFLGQRPILNPHSRGPENSNFPEAQGRVAGGFLENPEILVSELLNFLRQRVVAFPKSW
jgi:hypothetical protein